MKRRRSAQKRRTRRWLIFLLILLALLLFWPRRVSLEGLISPEAVLMDADSGEVLAEKNADASIYPASMTKVMTALLVLEANPDLDTPVTLPEDIFPELRAEGASMAGFLPGEQPELCAPALRRGVLRGAGAGSERFGGSLCGVDEPKGRSAGDGIHPLLQPHRPALPGACFHRAGHGCSAAGGDAE